MTPLETFTKDFKGKKVLIMGLGIQGGGVGVALFLQKIGSIITITDLRSTAELKESLAKIDVSSIHLTLGGHQESDFQNCDCIIRNPGVPIDNAYLKLAKSLGKPIYMETALFAKYTDCQIIGITGTRGKTTTTTMIYNLLAKNLSQKLALAGNIPGSSSLELLESSPEIAVLELSSWQLQGFDDLKISPSIAVLTNIYPDHLNRYASMADYIRDKAVITKYQTDNDYLIYNQDNPECVRIAKTSKANLIPFSFGNLSQSVVLKIPGSHNRANAAAADKVGQIMGIGEAKRYKSLQSQESIPFRLEKVALKNGVSYVNDTTSTTPVALITAINSLDEKAVVIVGGQSKKLPTDELIEVLNSRPLIKCVILIPGSGTDEIRKHLNIQKIGGQVSTLEEAVELAETFAQNGETILFSPGFTSFDQYRNEFERGKHFNQIVAGTA